MKSIHIITTILLLSTGVAFGQQDKKAKDLLDKASTAFTNAGGIKASFSFTLENTKAKTNEAFIGTISMSGNKFLIETPDYTAWYNGVNQWVYMKATEEVNLTNPSPDETQMMNPAGILTGYQKGFNYKYTGAKTLDGKKVDEVELIPQKKGELKKIVIQLDRTNRLPVSIYLQNTNGMNNRVKIAKYQTNLQFPDNLFSFNKSKYPNAELIDLR